MLLEPLSVQNFEGLAPKERAILAFLLKNEDRVISIDEILREAWEPTGPHDRQLVTVHICYMRPKVSPHKIENVRRQGYRFIRAAA